MWHYGTWPLPKYHICYSRWAHGRFPVSSWLFVGDVKWPDGNVMHWRQHVKLWSGFSIVISEGVEPAHVHNVFLRLEEGEGSCLCLFPWSSKGVLTSFFFPPCHRNTIPIKTLFHVDLRGSPVFGRRMWHWAVIDVLQIESSETAKAPKSLLIK